MWASLAYYLLDEDLQSLEHAQKAAAAAIDAGAETVALLPRNGFEVNPSEPYEPEDSAAEAAPDNSAIELMTDEALLDMAREHGLEASRDTSVAKRCTCNGTGDAFVTCAVHGRFR